MYEDMINRFNANCPSVEQFITLARELFKLIFIGVYLLYTLC